MYRFVFVSRTSEQRLYQQIGYVQQTLSRVKIVHRVRFDQTFSAKATEFRYRYSVGAELPRSGFRTDPGEHYFAVLAEYLVKFQDSKYTPELRLAFQFGCLFRNTNKGEVLLEIRIDELGSRSESLFLLGLSYYLSK
jgi:DNA-binding XRE family transcriptional regulator